MTQGVFNHAGSRSNGVGLEPTESRYLCGGGDGTRCRYGLRRRAPRACDRLWTVLIDGKPLHKGNITFVPEGGRPSAAKIESDGRFELRCFDDDDGALLGTHRVAVSAKDIISETNIKWHAPAEYSDYQTSGLTVEVTEAVDDLVIELTWDGKKPRGK